MSLPGKKMLARVGSEKQHSSQTPRCSWSHAFNESHLFKTIWTFFLRPSDSSAQLTASSLLHVHTCTYTYAHTPEGVGTVPENPSLCCWSSRATIQCTCDLLRAPSRLAAAGGESWPLVRERGVACPVCSGHVWSSSCLGRHRQALAPE